MKKYIILAIIILIIVAGDQYILNSKTEYTKYVPPDPTPTPVPITTPITLTEVSKHNEKTDCWVAIDKSVYDMTQFVSMHPGGNAILQGCGHDASILFNSVASHGPGVRDLLQTFKIGILVDK